MARTSIEWTDRTWNPTTGCDKVSPGCDNCYAMTMAGRLKLMGSKRYQKDGDPRTSGPGFALQVWPDKLNEPFSYAKPSMVFVDSMSDLFHPEVPDEFIIRVFEVMRDTPQHTYQVLTKRPQRMAKMAMHHRLLGPWPPNVWPGTSVESRKYLYRLNHLRTIGAKVRMLSAEPLLGPLGPLPMVVLDTLEWVIVGGESGHGRRPFDPDWAREIRDQCRDARVPFFMKQIDKVLPIPEDLMIREWPV